MKAGIMFYNPPADEEWGTDSNLSLGGMWKNSSYVLVVSSGKMSARCHISIMDKSAYCLAFYVHMNNNCRQDALLLWELLIP